MREKISITKTRGLIILTIIAMVLSSFHSIKIAEAINCPELRIVFARGSGGIRWEDQNYLSYKDTIEEKLKTTDLNYEFIDLDYPAIGVGTDNLGVTIKAYIGAGDSYEFGESVDTGVNNLVQLVKTCPNTKYVIGGYSQGAMVISKSLSQLNPDQIIYAATFGDPKIYLPEGKGLLPDACYNRNLSDYRMYVPDCQAYKGLLGAYVPYRPDSLAGKVGTWCNRRDIFCSSRHNITDHVSYVEEDLYEDASRVIIDKISRTFGIKNTFSSPHDTAIVIDSTGSMRDMIKKYKDEALRLATETLAIDGRVALYDYRDLGDPYSPVEHCNFETCTLEVFENALNNITTDGGGDRPESLLSTSFHVMKSLKWKKGSTKSLVVLTDADFLSPDRDGMTFDEVAQLSKTIDPVNFYIITNSRSADSYHELASATDGKVVTLGEEISLLTDFILERFDSLPRVEETTPLMKPYLSIKKQTKNSNSITLEYETNGDQTLIIINDQVQGFTNQKTITINNLNYTVQNKVILVPLKGDVRGDGVEIILDNAIIPKAPNTGQA